MHADHRSWQRDPLYWFVAGAVVGAAAMVLLLHWEGRVVPARPAPTIQPTSANLH